jgi:hypothetical protein
MVGHETVALDLCVGVRKALARHLQIGEVVRVPGGRRQVPASLIQRGFVEVEEGEPFVTPAGCAAVVGWRSKGMERFVVEIE